MLQTSKAVHAELKAAFGTKWAVLTLIFAGIVARYDWLAHKLEGHGMNQLIGIPDWLAGLLVFAIWTAATAVWHAVKLRRLVTPQFKMSFDEGGLGVVLALERSSVVIPAFTVGGQDTHTTVDTRATYIRLRLETLSDVAVTGCVAFLKKLDARALTGGVWGPIPLPQPVPLHEKPFDVFPKIPKFVDFAVAVEKNDKLRVVGSWPLILENVMKVSATYRFILVVTGPGGSQEIAIDVNWAGQWDTVTAHVSR